MCGFVSLPCIHVFLLLTSEWRSCFQVFCFAVLMKLIYVRCFGFSGSAPFSCCATETRCSGLQFATWLHRFRLGLGWACTTCDCLNSKGQGACRGCFAPAGTPRPVKQRCEQVELLDAMGDFGYFLSFLFLPCFFRYATCIGESVFPCAGFSATFGSSSSLSSSSGNLAMPRSPDGPRSAPPRSRNAQLGLIISWFSYMVIFAIRWGRCRGSCGGHRFLLFLFFLISRRAHCCFEH